MATVKAAADADAAVEAATKKLLAQKAVEVAAAAEKAVAQAAARDKAQKAEADAAMKARFGGSKEAEKGDEEEESDVSDVEQGRVDQDQAEQDQAEQDDPVPLADEEMDDEAVEHAERYRLSAIENESSYEYYQYIRMKKRVHPDTAPKHGSSHRSSLDENLHDCTRRIIFVFFYKY